MGRPEDTDRESTNPRPHETTVVPVPPFGDQQAMSIDPPGDATTETSGKGSGKDYRVAGARRQGPDGDKSPPNTS